MKKWELVVEANSFDGSQTFACEALTKFKSGLCEIIEVNVEVVGLEDEPMLIEESICIESRLSQDINSALTKEVEQFKKDKEELVEHLQNLVTESVELAQFKNDTLRKNICSTDLDEPEWHDYQTIGKAGAYLEQLKQQDK